MSESDSQNLNDESSVGRWVAQHPETAKVLETLRIDYYCNGDKSLEKVCWENGLEVVRVHSSRQRCSVVPRTSSRSEFAKLGWENIPPNL